MVAVLTPKSGGKPIVVDKAVILVGRHPDCDYILQSSRKVSRRHVCIVQVNEKYMVRDLGSMNGVSVNGDRVKNEHPIGIGDEVAIGDQLFRFEELQRLPRPPRPKAAAAPPTRPEVVEDEQGVTDEATDSPHVLTPPEEDDLSREFPVAIPDEGEDKSFVVVDDEESVIDSTPTPSPENDDGSFLGIGDFDDVGLAPTNGESRLNSAAMPIEEEEVLNPLDDLLEEVGPIRSKPVDDFEPIVDIDEDDIEDLIILDEVGAPDDDEDDEDIIILE